jgi:galactokinase
MDQFAVANGKQDRAMLLNCDSLAHKFVPLELDEYSLLIINSNKPRTLADSAYNQRREECEIALKKISEHRIIQHLVLADEGDLLHLSDEVLKKRTRHAFSEQDRVVAAQEALENGNLNQFGQLLSQSHNSLKNDFEVSCTELDFIVEHLLKSDDCLGARMTGAGFGGCCVALVHTESVPTISESLTLAYDENFGYRPSIYPCQPSTGVRQLNND